MKTGQLDQAVRIALTNFDKWVESSGTIGMHTSAYYEIQACIEESVHIGVQMAEFGNVKRHSTTGYINPKRKE